jgi:hypothetical protein
MRRFLTYDCLSGIARRLGQKILDMSLWEQKILFGPYFFTSIDVRNENRKKMERERKTGLKRRN